MNLVSKCFTKVGSHNVKLCSEAGKAVPGSSIATLAQKQVNMKSYCDVFNKVSFEFIENFKKKYKDLPIFSVINLDDFVKSKLFVKLRIYDAKAWELKIKSTSISSLIKMAIKLEKGCATPGKANISSIKKSILIEIAKLKMHEMNARVLESALKTVIGTARSMGVNVIND